MDVPTTVGRPHVYLGLSFQKEGTVLLSISSMAWNLISSRLGLSLQQDETELIVWNIPHLLCRCQFLCCLSSWVFPNVATLLCLGAKTCKYSLTSKIFGTVQCVYCTCLKGICLKGEHETALQPVWTMCQGPCPIPVGQGRKWVWDRGWARHLRITEQCLIRF